MKQSSKELKKFSSQIRFTLDNYTPHGISKESINAVLICGIGGAGIAGRIVKDYFQDKFSLPVDTVSGYLLPRYADRNTLVVIWSYSGEHEEALAVYDIARERQCRLIVISSGGILGAKARQDMEYAGQQEIRFYPAEAGFASGMALGYALGYLFQLIFEMLGVYKKPDLVKIADNLENSHDYLQRSGDIAARLGEHLQHKFIIICDSFFEGAATRFCQQVNQAAGTEAFIHILPEGGYHVLETYTRKQNSNFIFLNSRLSPQINTRFADVKNLIEKNGMTALDLLVTDASLNTLFHIVHLLDWLALQAAGIALDTETDMPEAAPGRNGAPATSNTGPTALAGD